MRSLPKAARTVVLVTLTGAAPGCGYDNPGFKLKDSDPESDSAAQTTSVSGVTMMTTTETAPTTTSVTSTTESMTTQGPGVSGSETSTSTTGDTTETSDTTMGMAHLEWPLCDLEETLPGPTSLAIADTFLLNATGGGECFPKAGAECKDLNLGGVPYSPLYYSDGGSFDGPADDYTSIFLARFETPPYPKHDGVMVPESSRIGMRVTIHMTQPANAAEWSPTTFNIFGLGNSDVWQEGTASKEPQPCVSPGASFQCRECDVGESCLMSEWSLSKYAYMPGDVPKMSSTLEEKPDGIAGADVKFDILIEDSPFLTKGGMVLIPQMVATPTKIGVNTKESQSGAVGPFIQFLYCPPKIIMP